MNVLDNLDCRNYSIYRGEKCYIKTRPKFNLFSKTIKIIIMPLYLEDMFILGEKAHVYKFFGKDIYIQYKDINDFKKYWKFISI